MISKDILTVFLLSFAFSAAVSQMWQISTMEGRFGVESNKQFQCDMHSNSTEASRNRIRFLLILI